MHIFPALICKLRHDATNDKEVLRDWDFSFIHCTVDNNNGCLKTSVIMVYCAAFDCNANSSKNKVTCSWFKFPMEPTLFKKCKRQADEAQSASLTLRKLVSTAIRTRESAALGYLSAKISLKEEDVPTLFPVVEAMLISPIHRTQAGKRASATAVHLGSKRAVSADTSDVSSR